MTRIEFYFNVTDKQKLMLSLVEQALLKRRQVTVFTANQLDSREVVDCLWQRKRDSFLPNVLASHVHAANTPVVIACAQNETGEIDAIFQDDMLINLTVNQPSFFSRFTHLVEIVGNDDTDKLNARSRYKFYRDRGYEIKHNDHAKLVEANIE